MLNKVFGEVAQIGIKIAVLIVAVIVIVNSSKWAYSQAYELMSRTPSMSEEIKNVSVTIPKGASTEAIANILADNGLIESTMYFRIIARLNGYDSGFQYGDYTFSTAQSEEDMMEILITEGAKRATKQFTIVEGLTLAEVAESLADQGMCTEKEFYQALDGTNWGYRFLDSIPKLADRKVLYQGYLLPETYEVYEDATPVDVIGTMFAEMDKLWSDEYYAQAEAKGMTVDEIITIASIIEREVVEPSEQKLVSGVIYNRLKVKMPLQMCSTVMYVLEVKRNRLTYADLEIKSPYNTYNNSGLPIGPIANPGASAIKAALFPDNNDYLYFVLKDDGSGTHEFNSTLQEHNNDKAKYVNTFNY